MFSLLIITSIFLVYILGTFFTLDFRFALYELKKVIFWVVIPVAFYISPRLSDKKIHQVFFIFILSVFVSSLLYTFKYLIDKNSITDFRTIGYISHIRFSFQVILSLILLIYYFVESENVKTILSKVMISILFLWFISFLFLLQSLIGIVAFFGTAIIISIYYMYKFTRRNYKILFSILLVVFIAIPSYFMLKVLRDFYSYKQIDPSEVEYRTMSGNAYEFDFENDTRENGNLVYVYICHDELRKEWNKRSKIKYDEEINGYQLSNTLIRYLASMGLRKDSVAISKLTDKDIELIENGVTNYKFRNRFFSIYPRVYQTIWEINNYLQSGDPNNKSLAQRIEYLKASVILIGKHPIFGIGTGNWKIKYNEVYDNMNSRLEKDKRASSHNQYLNYMVKFGIIGFLWILAAIIIPFFKENHRRNFVFASFLIAMAIANFGDANLETHMGLSFFTFFYCLLLWHSPSAMKKSIRS